MTYIVDLTARLSYANAGHPPPVWASASGQLGYLDDTSGVMLGVPGEAEFTVGRRTLEPGTSLLFYTDGLIEDRRRDITDGLSALAGVMGQAPSLSAEKTCATVQAALLGETPRADDVCLLAVRFLGLATSGAAGTGPGAVTQPAVPVAVRSPFSLPSRSGRDLPGRLHPGNEALDNTRDADGTVSLQIRRLRSSDAT